MAGEICTIVPTFNRAAYLIDAISAIFAQTHAVSRIIIWDDGSTDETPAIVSDLASSHPGLVQSFRAENSGKARALNAALSRVEADYVWICDDDDIACPDAIAKLVSAIETSGAKLAGGRHIRFRDCADGERITYDTGYWPDLSSGSPLRHILEDVFFFQNGSLFETEALRSVGPFREDLSRSIDYEMFVRFASRYPVKVIDDVIFLQRKHEGARGPAAARHHADQAEAVWRRHDLEIFRDFREVLPLDLYEALYRSSDLEIRRRAALLQRATVYARRTDWELALVDFEAAAARMPNRALSLLEREIVKRAMSGKHGLEEAMKPSIRKGIIALSGHGPAGRDILGSLRRGTLWQARASFERRDFPKAVKLASFAGPFVWQGFRQADTQSDLIERSVLEPDAYEW